MSTVQTTTVIALEWADAYGMEIMTARIPTDEEKSQWAEWFRPVALYGVKDGARQKLEYFTWRDLEILGRKATHSFPGCSNGAWILSDAERDQILAIENERRDAAVAKARAVEQAEVAKIEEIKAEAIRSGKDQVLTRWMSDCSGGVVDCSFDACARMVRPDGTEYTTKSHCF